LPVARGERCAETFAEIEMLDVKADVDRETLAARSGIAGASNDRGVRITSMRAELAAHRRLSVQKKHREQMRCHDS
jgi:hypothetical protein